jgi:hypothetical protein
MTNSEGMTNDEAQKAWCAEIVSSFELRHSFVILHSGFVIPFGSFIGISAILSLLR